MGCKSEPKALDTPSQIADSVRLQVCHVYLCIFVFTVYVRI